MLFSLLLAATPIDLIWNVSPSPHGDYAACTDNTTVCTNPGEWWGICRAEQFGATQKTLTSGTLSLENKQARFSACPHYQLLLSKSAREKLGGDAKKAAFAQPGCSSGDVGLAPFGTGALAYKREGSRVRFAQVTSNSCADLEATKWGDPIAIAWPGPASLSNVTNWDVTIIGDLNQDGAIELLFESERQAIFGTLRENHFEALAYTVTTPKIAQSDEERRVEAVTAAHESCAHWGDEEAYDDKRREEILAGSKRDCTAYKKSLAAALKKYPRNAKLKALGQE